jgi:tight adherence protein C
MLLAYKLLDLEQLTPFAIFGCVAAACWLLLDMFSSRKSRAGERLEEFVNPTQRKRKEDAPGGKRSDPMAKVLAMATPALSKALRPKSEFEVSKLRLRLANAGFRSEAAGNAFLSLKVIGLGVGLLASGVTLTALQRFDQNSMIAAVLSSGFAFFAPDIVLWFMIRKRKEAIFLALPDALDLMVVCVEAGLGLDQAMRKVSEEMKKTYPVIADEFGLANFQLQMGRAKTDVLHELGSRSGVDDLRSLAAILIQADKFGSSIAQALRVQSDSMRTRRRQLAEERAAKTAVKLIFPLVLFIFPGIFVVLVGPAAITMVRDMFPAMTKS